MEKVPSPVSVFRLEVWLIIGKLLKSLTHNQKVVLVIFRGDGPLLGYGETDIFTYIETERVLAG